MCYRAGPSGKIGIVIDIFTSVTVKVQRQRRGNDVNFDNNTLL